MVLPFSIPFFAIAATGFALFTLAYAGVSIAIIYHLRSHSISGRLAPHVVTVIFLVASIALWLFALFFLFEFKQ